MGPRIVAVMPAYNEADGIAEFLEEIVFHLGAGTSVVVVDDTSTDGTGNVVRRLAQQGLPVTLVTNDVNLGHGPSTVKALRAGLVANPDVLVAVDGDGQFFGEDIARLVKLITSSDLDIVEGVRTQRGDPFFRRVASAVTRLLVRAKTSVPPLDANTPLRVYRPAALETLLERIPADAMTPNLLMSALARTSGHLVHEERVSSRVRRGAEAGGSTWQARHTELPSRRFIIFCAKAGVQWASLSRRIG